MFAHASLSGWWFKWISQVCTISNKCAFYMHSSWSQFNCVSKPIIKIIRLFVQIDVVQFVSIAIRLPSAIDRNWRFFFLGFFSKILYLPHSFNRIKLASALLLAKWVHHCILHRTLIPNWCCVCVCMCGLF